jgi:hypothetical protein
LTRDLPENSGRVFLAALPGSCSLLEILARLTALWVQGDFGP